MTATQYEPARTGLLVGGPLQRLPLRRGEVRPFVEEAAKEVGRSDNLRAAAAAARAAGVQVFIVPHRRWREGNYQNWNYPDYRSSSRDEAQIFAAGSWGGDGTQTSFLRTTT